MLQTFYEKGEDLHFTRMDELLSAATLNIKTYDPDMRLKRIPAFVSHNRNIISSADEAEAWVIKNKKPLVSEGLIRQTNQVLNKLICLRTPLPNGGVRGDLTMITLDTLYHGWFNHLDYTAELLILPAGQTLSRIDMQTLHLYLKGHAQKDIAKLLFLSRKTVENRLRRVKDKLCAAGSEHASLAVALSGIQLSDFILAEPDWFNLSPSHRNPAFMK